MARQNFFQIMTAEEYRRAVGISKSEPTKNKYHAQKTEVDGIKFDSKKEYSRWMHLKGVEQMGLISDLQRQVSFELQPKFTNNKGEPIKAINYIADFTYTQDGKKIVEDVKGGKATQTDVFKLKKKLFEYKYPEYEFVIS